MAASPIKQVAEKAGVPIVQPVKMKDPAFLDALRGMAAGPHRGDRIRPYPAAGHSRLADAKAA